MLTSMYSPMSVPLGEMPLAESLLLRGFFLQHSTLLLHSWPLAEESPSKDSVSESKDRTERRLWQDLKQMVTTIWKIKVKEWMENRYIYFHKYYYATLNIPSLSPTPGLQPPKVKKQNTNFLNILCSITSFHSHSVWNSSIQDPISLNLSFPRAKSALIGLTKHKLENEMAISISKFHLQRLPQHLNTQ